MTQRPRSLLAATRRHEAGLRATTNTAVVPRLCVIASAAQCRALRALRSALVVCAARALTTLCSMPARVPARAHTHVHTHMRTCVGARVPTPLSPCRPHSSFPHLLPFVNQLLGSCPSVSKRARGRERRPLLRGQRHRRGGEQHLLGVGGRRRTGGLCSTALRARTHKTLELPKRVVSLEYQRTP